MNKILDFAENLLSEEIACIPTQKNKAPALSKGSEYFNKIVPEDKAAKVFENACGLGVKCGKISEGIECLDFDDHDGKHGIIKVVSRFSKNDFILTLINEKKLYIQSTLNGGFHFVYRYENETYESSKKLAYWSDGEVMIETRGEGAYFVSAPSEGYTVRSGDLVKLETISKEDRDLIIDIAKSFNQQKTAKTTIPEIDGLRTEPTDPISQFNLEQIAYAKKLLEDEGWQKSGSDDSVEYWTRPGKDEGTSATWGYKYNSLYVWSSNAHPFMQNMYYSPFQILIKLRFKGNFDRALQWVSGKEIAKNDKIPYMRIGVDYYKVIYKVDRYGINRRILKAWKKEEIKQDYGKEFLKEIPRYDDFVLVPDNINHQTIINNCFNMYAPFPYEPAPGQTKWSDILMEHIFGEQLEQGYQYMKALYENPDKILPILAIVSQQRETGKTTYLNWLSMIFGDNSITVESESLLKSHNSEYADKNLILIEEAKVDKSTATEKLKRLSTQKELTVDPKFVQPYKLPCYFKIVILSNDEDKFAKVDDEEIRFFVRKVGDIKHRNTDIESDLLKEIPAFLDKLAKMPALDFTKSRMLFTAEELNNESLQKVKKESKPELYKELFEYFTNIFEDSRDQDMKYFFVRPKEIKEYWFKSMSNITASYIRKILINEFKFNITSKNRRHEAFTDKSGELNGKPFVIPKSFFIDDNDEVKDMNEAPDVYVQDNELPF